MLTRLQSLGAKIEATSETAETIVAADVVLVSNIQFTPETPTLEVENFTSSMSKDPGVAGRTKGQISFDMFKYGGTGPGVVPSWGKFFRCCGHSETIVAATSVTYAKTSAGIPTLTIKSFIDGVVMQLIGCKGNVASSGQAGELPKFTFTFEGLWEPVTDVDAVKDEAILAGSSLENFSPDKFQNVGLTVDTAYMPVLHSLDWDSGNVLNVVPDGNVTNYRRVDITDRDPSGTMVVDKVTQAVYDFVRKAADKTAVAIKSYINSVQRGNGTGAASSMTDLTKNWITDQWAGFEVLDSAGATFSITANSATALTVSGTPANGNYVVYIAGRLIEETMVKCEFQSASPGDVNGTATISLPFKMRRNAPAGNDEHEIKLF